MVQRVPGTYRFDPDDPRAPTQAEWDSMSAEERDRVVAVIEANELLIKLGTMIARQAAASRQGARDVERAIAAAERASTKAARAADLEQRLIEAMAEIERLRGQR